MAASQDRLPFDLDLRVPCPEVAPEAPASLYDRTTLALLMRAREEFEPDFRDLREAEAHLPPQSERRARDRWVHEASWRVTAWPHGLRRNEPVRLIGPSELSSVTCPEGREVPLRFADLAQRTHALDRGSQLPAAPPGDPCTWIHHLRVGHIAGIRPRSWEAWACHPAQPEEPVPALLLDLSLYVAEHARVLIALGIPSLLLLPGPSEPTRARLWHDLLTFLEDQTGVAYGELRVLWPIDPATSEWDLDAALFHLRDRVCGVLEPWNARLAGPGEIRGPQDAARQDLGRTLGRRNAVRLVEAP